MKYRYIVHMRQSKDAVIVHSDSTPTYSFDGGIQKNTVYIGYSPSAFWAQVDDVEYIEGGICPETQCAPPTGGHFLTTEGATIEQPPMF
jgi:hypothetical protein